LEVTPNEGGSVGVRNGSRIGRYSRNDALRL